MPEKAGKHVELILVPGIDPNLAVVQAAQRRQSSRILAGVFFFNDPATTELYTLSLHDALPIRPVRPVRPLPIPGRSLTAGLLGPLTHRLTDRKSTRLNSSHLVISYALFCL